MNKWGMKGIVLGLCLSMMAPMAVAIVPGISVEAAATGTPAESTQTKQDLLDKAIGDASDDLADYKTLIDPDNKYTKKLDEIITKAKDQIKKMNTVTGITNYVSKAKAQMDAVVNPPKDDSKDDKGDKDDNTTVPVNADHFLTVGGNWVTPVANAGQPVSIVLPIVNMGKTNVTKAVVTPVLSTDTATWPFEITQSGYSQTI